jgi:hypothetical protein
MASPNVRLVTTTPAVIWVFWLQNSVRSANPYQRGILGERGGEALLDGGARRLCLLGGGGGRGGGGVLCCRRGGDATRRAVTLNPFPARACRGCASFRSHRGGGTRRRGDGEHRGRRRGHDAGARCASFCVSRCFARGALCVTCVGRVASLLNLGGAFSSPPTQKSKQSSCRPRCKLIIELHVSSPPIDSRLR